MFPLSSCFLCHTNKWCFRLLFSKTAQKGILVSDKQCTSRTGKQLCQLGSGKWKVSKWKVSSAEIAQAKTRMCSFLWQKQDHDTNSMKNVKMNCTTPNTGDRSVGGSKTEKSSLQQMVSSHKTQAHSHIHTHTHTRTHVCKHTHAHTRTYTNTHTVTHTHTHTHTH